MPDNRLEGDVSFVQYEKKFVTIDYVHNGKKKQVNGSIKDEQQQKLKDEKLVTDMHYFREGDHVMFDLVRSVRGDKMTADRIVFMYNNSYSNLLHRARTENEFAGYLKQVGDDFFIKEIGSYHFFPIRFSAWELRPSAASINDPVYFRLENISNPEKVSALLLDRKFIPGYSKAMKFFQEKKSLRADVVRLSPHGVYVNLPDVRMQAKLPLRKGEVPEEKEGDSFNVIITYLGPDKFAVAKSDQQDTSARKEHQDPSPQTTDQPNPPETIADQNPSSETSDPQNPPATTA